LAIEFDEEAIRGRDEVVILGQIVWCEGRSAKQFRDEFRPVLVRQGVELVEQLLGGLRHTIRLALAVLAVKFRWRFRGLTLPHQPRRFP
jgi:hypothetical protein